MLQRTFLCYRTLCVKISLQVISCLNYRCFFSYFHTNHFFFLDGFLIETLRFDTSARRRFSHIITFRRLLWFPTKTGRCITSSYYHQVLNILRDHWFWSRNICIKNKWYARKLGIIQLSWSWPVNLCAACYYIYTYLFLVVNSSDDI